jgi:hypothetical protein
MGKSLRHQQALYLGHDRAKLFDKLSADTWLAKQVLLREAVDDPLVKYKRLKVPKQKPKSGARRCVNTYVHGVGERESHHRWTLNF